MQLFWEQHIFFITFYILIWNLHFNKVSFFEPPCTHMEDEYIWKGASLAWFGQFGFSLVA